MSLFTGLNTWLTGLLGPLGPLIAVGLLGLVLVLVALPTFLKRQKDPLARLAESNSKPSREGGALRSETGVDKLERYSNFLEPQDEKEYSAVRLKLTRAGYRSKNAVRMYHFLQFSLGLGLLAVGFAYASYLSATSPDGISTKEMVLYTLVPGLVGYMAPKRWVAKREKARTEEIVNGFPDSLDMMLVCVEAGQSMDQSILRVSKELKAGFPALAEEYEMVTNEIKAGKDKTQVLRDMAERCGVADIASFVTVLVQSQTFGTSIADALRVYAAEMRDKRVMRAEEKANTLPTKMTLTTMMLTVPPLLIILIGPSVYGVATMLGGGGVAEQTGLGN